MFSLGILKYYLEIDDKEAQLKIKEFEKSLTSFGNSAKKIGGSLSKNLTLPILAAGGAALKLASDFEVASRKFAGAFKGSETAAVASVERLNKEFGIAKSQGTALLAFTGDLLKGFGASSDEALALATSTTELSAALAAYSGVPVKQASEAVTKALLGEREGLKLLGVSIQESAVQAELLKRGQQDLTGQSLLLAKAQITLKLAAEQSQDAIAGFASNTDTLAYQSGLLIANLKDLAVTVGSKLLPVVKNIVKSIKDWTDKISNLTTEQITTILKIAALTAALGPLITVTGQASLAIKGLSAAIAFLAANPIVAAVAALAGLGLGLAALVEINNKKQIKELSEQFGKIGEETGVAKKNMDAFVKAAGLLQNSFKMNTMSKTLQETSDWIDQIVKNMGLTREQIIKVGLASDGLSKDFRSQLETLLKQEDALDAAAAAELKRADIRKDGVSDIKDEVAAAEEELQKKKDEEIAAAKKAADDAKKAYQEKLSVAQQTVEANKSEIQLINDKIKLLQNFSTNTKKDETERLAAIKLLEAEKAKITQQEIEDAEKVKQAKIAADIEEQLLKEEIIKQVESEYQELMKKTAQETKDNWTATAASIQSSFNNINDAINLSGENWQETFDKVADSFLKSAIASGNAYVMAAAVAVKAISSVVKAVTNLGSIEEQRKKIVADVEAQITEIRFQALKERIEREYKEEKAAIDKIEEEKLSAYLATLSEQERETLRANNIIEESDLQRIEREKKAAIASGDEQALALLEREEIIESIRAEAEAKRDAAEKAYLNKKAQYEYDKAVSDKRARIIQIKADKQSALASLKWWQWLANWDADVKRVYNKLKDEVSSLVIPPPVFLASGGVATEATSAIVGEAGPEAILPLNDKTLSKLGQAITASTMGSTSPSKQTSGDVVINFEGNRLAVIRDGVNILLRDRKILIPSSALI